MININRNICKFIPSAEIDTDINVLNFIYEANWNNTDEMCKTSFMLCLVVAGSGQYITTYGKYNLAAGDIFFIFSTKTYTLLNDGNLEFCYISFVGARVHPLLNRLNIKFDCPYFRGYDSLIPFWKDSIMRAGSHNSDLVAHSVLYYTFSFILNDNYEKSLPDKSRNLISEIKRYIDNNYCDTNISLTYIANKFGYSSKYISDRFKRTMMIPITVYITNRRMEYAKAMIAEGNFSVFQISEACGYNDPLYFSKVFKRNFGISPLTEIKSKSEGQ